MQAFAVAVAAFPANPGALHRSASLELLTPRDGKVYPFLDATNLTLRYASHGLVGAQRLCLELMRGPLRYYRGPLLYRDATAHARYASGCFAMGQAVTLQRLSPGNFMLQASARDGHDFPLVNTTVFFALADRASPLADGGGAELEPTYEWQTVPPLATVPAGLEIRMDLSGGSKTARIPPSWRLQVYVGERIGFFRFDVSRSMRYRPAELEPDASLALSLPPQLWPRRDEPLCVRCAGCVKSSGRRSRTPPLVATMACRSAAPHCGQAGRGWTPTKTQSRRGSFSGEDASKSSCPRARRPPWQEE